jgi:N-methylhydantoinase A
VTDASLVLGRIPPHLLGGEVPLDPAAAAAGLKALGAKLGLGLAAVAAGVLEISAWNQANALRQVTVQRGLDVRDFVLATFGGSGSLAVCRLLELLGLPAAVVPRDPGNLSAFGLLTVDVKNDEVQTAVARHADLEVAAVAVTLATLQERAARSLDAEGFARPGHRYLRSADLRYFGQAFEVRVPVPDGPVDQAVCDATVAAFHDAHRRRYGYSFRDDPAQQVEWVNLRVTGVGPIRRPTLRPAPHPQPRAAGATPSASRPACFDPARGFVDTAIYRRNDLSPGDLVEGPAVVEEYGATVPLHPGFRARVDRFGNLVVTGPEAGEAGP